MSELLQFELTLPIAPEAELVAAGATEQIALQVGFDRNATDQIRSAVIEACINAFEHSGSPDRRVYLTFVAEEDKLLIVVRDFGKGFDPTKADPPRIKERLRRMHKRGWGLVIITRFMDKVEFLDISPGTELRMTKYLTRDSAAPASP
jgi:serine/threonine-protein kinase RsbW